MSDIIQVENLVKVYSDGTRAISGVSFSVKEGEFFGFLGPNGAGKSTTIKVLATLLEKTSGSVTVAGHDADSDAREIRKIIGVQSQETTVDGDLTGRDNLLLQGHLQRMRGKAVEQRADELLKVMGLSEVADRRVMYYSSGMKKRLDLASVFIHRPRIVFLDEPTAGLDPQSREKTWTYLQSLNRDQGVTIFLTTQYLEEADRLCNRVSIIDQGHLIVTGSPNELKQKVGGDKVIIGLAGADSGEGFEEAQNIARGVEGVTKVLSTDNGLALYTKDGSRIVPEIVKAFDDRGITPASVNLYSPSLDDVFLQYTGKSFRPEPLAKHRKRRRIPFH
jgi:ABC-2 type transport system ATP-binding protein